MHDFECSYFVWGTASVMFKAFTPLMSILGNTLHTVDRGHFVNKPVIFCWVLF